MDNAYLSGIPMKFNSVDRVKISRYQSSVRFENSNTPRSIVFGVTLVNVNRQEGNFLPSAPVCLKKSVQNVNEFKGISYRVPAKMATSWYYGRVSNTSVESVGNTPILVSRDNNDTVISS